MNFEEMKNACIVEVLKDIKTETEALGTWRDELMIETVDIERVLEIINRKIKEHGGEA